MQTIYSEQYTIHSYEADYKGKASFLSLCNFLQEVAWKHAEIMGLGYSHLIKKDLIWIMLRQSISVKQYPDWGDKIIVKTWPSGFDKLFCYRKFEIFDSENNVLAEAIFTWMVIDLKSKRPQRTESYFFAELPDEFMMIPKTLPPKLDKDINGKLTSTIDVTVTDLDVNNHVNNVTYIKWIIDSLTLEFHNENELIQLHTNFLAEATYGDKVDIYLNEGSDSKHNIVLQRQSDCKPLYLAELKWGKVK
ncbi:MAG: hypothetical protein JEY94_16920 [Melioribacteraceae bacterium]|nr:hypothetical protein [Melioribacteraceae bacterium]